MTNFSLLTASLDPFLAMSLRQLTLVAISLGLIGTSEANTGDGTHCPPGLLFLDPSSDTDW